MKTSIKIKYLIIFYAIIITLGFGLGMYIERIYPVRASASVVGAYLPTQTEIQQILVDRGYDIGPDGIDGVIGEDSRDAWDLAKCDEFYKESMTRATTDEGPGTGQFEETK